MRVVRKASSGRGVAVGTAEIPKPAPGEVLIKVIAAGVCGTDLHIFKWDEWSQRRITPPVIIGHEFVGEICEIGSKNSRFSIGQRVSAEGHITCGQCRYCRNGQAHICKDVKIIGVDINGCFAEYICMPETNIWPVADEIANKYAAIFDPLGNAMHTVMAQPVAMKNVLVTGAGSIGLFAVPIAKKNGASKVIVVEPNEMKKEIARKVGADLVIDPSDKNIKDIILENTAGMGPDVLLEMSGNAGALHLGLDVLCNGGIVSLLGIPSREISLNLAEQVIFKGITLHGITGRRMYETWYQCESFLKTSAKSIDPIITHTLKLEEAEKAFLMMENNEAVKVLLEI